MAYTHDFEIQVNGLTIQGEMDPNHGQNPVFKTTSGEEMSLVQHGEVHKLYAAIVHFSAMFGTLHKIEIVKKP